MQLLDPDEGLPIAREVNCEKVPTRFRNPRMNKERIETRLVIPTTVFLCLFIAADEITDRRWVHQLVEQVAKIDPKSQWLVALFGAAAIGITIGFTLSMIFSAFARPLFGNEFQWNPCLGARRDGHIDELRSIECLIAKSTNQPSTAIKPVSSVENRYFWWSDDKSRVSIYRLSVLSKELREWIERRAHIVWISGNTATGILFLILFETIWGLSKGSYCLAQFGGWWLLTAILLFAAFLFNTILTLDEIHNFTRYCALREIGTPKPSENGPAKPT